MQLLHLGLGRRLGRFPVGLASRACLTRLSLEILDTWLGLPNGQYFNGLAGILLLI